MVKSRRLKLLSARQRRVHVLSTLAIAAAAMLAGVRPVEANQAQLISEAQRLAAQGAHYNAAILYFNASTLEGASQDASLAFLTESLVRAGFPNAASYFFIKTLQSGDNAAIRKVLPYLPLMIEAVGGDLLRKYVLRHTSESDYDAATRTHFHYFLGKDDLLKGEPAKALSSLLKVSGGAGLMAQGSYLKGAAYAMLGQHENAVQSFKTCARMAGRAESRSRALSQEFEDLHARCLAGTARAYYQKGDHDQAEETYDEIPKSSFVWTDVLFEQAWNAYAKNDYNRALGKLVTYRSPSLSFVFNPEVDVLRAQSALGLCRYDDVNAAVNEFNARYAAVGAQMKNLLLSHGNDLAAFYELARQAYRRKLHTGDMLHRALNRFIRGPYFAGLLAQQRAIQAEVVRARHLGSRIAGPKFAEFLEKVLGWRDRSARLLGGMFVRNFMTDLYQELLANLDKMSFIKLEMLKNTKTSLERRQAVSEDEDGALKLGAADVERRDYQYFWNFNGEFWVDELGDYVFALESQCGS